MSHQIIAYCLRFDKYRSIQGRHIHQDWTLALGALPAGRDEQGEACHTPQLQKCDESERSALIPVIQIEQASGTVSSRGTSEISCVKGTRHENLHDGSPAREPTTTGCISCHNYRRCLETTLRPSRCLPSAIMTLLPQARHRDLCVWPQGRRCLRPFRGPPSRRGTSCWLLPLWSSRWSCSAGRAWLGKVTASIGGVAHVLAGVFLSLVSVVCVLIWSILIAHRLCQLAQGISKKEALWH